MRFLQIFAIGLLFWVTPIVSSTLESLGDTGYQVVALTASIKESLDSSWKMCGERFAKMETKEQKIILFIFKKKVLPDNPVMILTFTSIERVPAPSINEDVTSPVVTITGSGRYTQFLFKMNRQDYVTALPCLGKGTEI